MATSSNNLEQDCLCPVCCDFYSDPIVLLCGHSFCKDCIQTWWTQSGSQACPVCKQMFPVGQPPRNLALKNLSDSVKAEAARQRASQTEDLCETHEERLKLFCVDHQMPICMICRDSKDHKKHTCVPIDEAAADSKKKLGIALMPLRTKLQKFNEEKLTCDKMSALIQVQSQQTEKKIKGEFQKLYQFLHAEEATRIERLRKEVEQKSQAMKIRIVNLTAEISSLSDTLKAAETELKAADLSFMLNYKAITQRAQCTVPDPETPSGALIDEALHTGNLLFHVWKKMKNIIQWTPFCMDSNTVSGYGTLSEDLRSLTRNDKLNEVPSNPERCVFGDALGSIGFSSGVHIWDVEVEEDWTLGVLSFTKLNEKIPYWACFRTCTLCIVEHTPTLFEKVIHQDYFPKKIRVQLEYDKGMLLFYDLDKKTFFHSITCKFTGPIFPFFKGTVKLIPHCPGVSNVHLTTPG